MRKYRIISFYNDAGDFVYNTQYKTRCWHLLSYQWVSIYTGFVRHECDAKQAIFNHKRNVYKVLKTDKGWSVLKRRHWFGFIFWCRDSTYFKTEKFANAAMQMRIENDSL